MMVWFDCEMITTVGEHPTSPTDTIKRKKMAPCDKHSWDHNFPIYLTAILISVGAS